MQLIMYLNSDARTLRDIACAPCHLSKIILFRTNEGSVYFQALAVVVPLKYDTPLLSVYHPAFRVYCAVKK